MALHKPRINSAKEGVCLWELSKEFHTSAETFIVVQCPHLPEGNDLRILCFDLVSVMINTAIEWTVFKKVINLLKQVKTNNIKFQRPHDAIIKERINESEFNRSSGRVNLHKVS